MNTWFLLLNNDNVILGVYGSALEDKAKEDFKSLDAMFPGMARVITSHPMERPKVGDGFEPLDLTA